MTVRIVRIIEVEYTDLAAFEVDSTHWTLPMHGTKRLGNTVFRCATINPTMLYDSPADPTLLPGDAGYEEPRRG